MKTLLREIEGYIIEEYPAKLSIACAKALDKAEEKYKQLKNSLNEEQNIFHRI